MPSCCLLLGSIILYRALVTLSILSPCRVINKFKDKLKNYLCCSTFSTARFQYSLSTSWTRVFCPALTNHQRRLFWISYCPIPEQKKETESLRMSQSSWFWTAHIFWESVNLPSKFSSSILLQDQDKCPGHPGCHISLTLTAASAASLVSPGTFAPGRGVCVCVCVCVRINE